jgi:hypothetical protein
MRARWWTLAPALESLLPSGDLRPSAPEVAPTLAQEAGGVNAGMIVASGEW